MKISYICSPFRAETEEQKQKHVDYARKLLKDMLLFNNITIAPHLLYTQILDDSNKKDRDFAMRLCRGWVSRANTIVVGCRYGISEGMKQEIALAEKLGKKIIYLEE